MRATLDTTSTKPRRILMVVANPSISKLTGWPIGFWASELIHPWYEFTEVGYEVTIASPDGGKVEIDFLSDPDDENTRASEDVLSRGFLATPALKALLDDTPRLADLAPEDVDALVLCGGQGPMYQYREHPGVQAAVRDFYETEKPTAALCHGVSALIDVKLSDGSYLIEGKTITGFADIEEDASNEAAGQTVQPWRIEDAARERGANYVQGGLWKAYAVRDGRLITGQQQFAGRKVAELVIQAVGA